jgi:hypothetical protein
MALGQRGWKWYPKGGFIGFGISPESTMRWRRADGEQKCRREQRLRVGMKEGRTLEQVQDPVADRHVESGDNLVTMTSFGASPARGRWRRRATISRQTDDIK